MNLPNSCFGAIWYGVLQQLDGSSMLLYVSFQLLPHAIRLSFLYILA